MIDITYIILGVLVIIAGVVARYVIPWITANTSAKDLSTAYKWVLIGCKAADQLVKTGVISKEERKNHVIEFLQNNGITINLDQIDQMIESICLELPPLLLDEENDDSDTE